MKYKKIKEKNYKYWNNIFDGHKGYMIASSDDSSEYGIIRGLIFNFIKDGESVLDVGCASGNSLEFSEHIDKNITYKGTDYAENFIKANKKRRPKMDWEVMDARDLKEKDGAFDNVVLYDVLDGLNGWEEAISEATRVARKRVLITMWIDAHMSDKLAYMRDKGLNCLEFMVNGDGFHSHYFIIGFKK